MATLPRYGSTFAYFPTLVYILNAFQNSVSMKLAFTYFCLIPTTGSDILKVIHERFGQTS